MTVKELKELIKNIPDDLVIGVKDHYGDFIEADKDGFYIDSKGYKSKELVFIIPIIYIGEEPD